MKKLILKELREHFKVALLGLAVLTVMQLLALSALNPKKRDSIVQRELF